MTTKYRLAILTSHPIQYQAPLFCKLAAHPNIDLMVYLYSNYGVTEKIDPGFGVAYKWDIPLLDGYNYKFLQNYFPRIFANGSWFLFNPGIIMEIFKEHYDAVLIHGYVSPTNWLAFLAAGLTGTPIIFRGETHLLNYRAGWKGVFKKIILHQLFKRISSFLTIGTLNGEYYRHYGVSDRKLFLAPYAVDNDYFSKRYQELHSRRDRLKKELGITPEQPVILYASKMIQRKKAMDLLKAFEKIQERIDVSLVFVGDGVERPVLEARAKDHNIRNVHFVGFKNQTELPDYYVIADVFVLPSTDEPWGLIINEVMNFNLPIITTDQVGASPDLVKDGENGFVYPVGDIERLASCLLKLIQSPELMEKMGKFSSEIISKWGYKEDLEGILSALEYVKATKRMN
ncbi:MAG: glycosyltransferase family 4 protein [Candidatus Scalinduaceae bacterium]